MKKPGLYANIHAKQERIAANGTGSVTITAAGLALSPVSPTQYAIVGNRTIARATDFTTGGDFFANTLNDELDSQTIFAQQNSEGLRDGFSVGAQINEWTNNKGVMQITSATLDEVSLVTDPAIDSARVIADQLCTV